MAAVRHYSNIGLGLLVVLLLSGCGQEQRQKSESGIVFGKVSLDDIPLDEGSVILEDTELGRTASAVIQKGGEFRISDPVAIGKYQIVILPAVPIEYGGGTSTSLVVVPVKYRQGTTSGLSADVIKGDNELDLILKSK